MSYTITTLLHHRDSVSGLRKVQIMITNNRSKQCLPTDAKIRVDQFEVGQVVRHENKALLNAGIRREITVMDKRMLLALQDGLIDDLTFKQVVKGDHVKPRNAVKLFEFIVDLSRELTGKFAAASMKNYR